MRQLNALQPADLAPALARVLAAPGRGKPADKSRVADFCDYLDECPVHWEGLRCGPPDAPSGLFFALLLPGATAVVMLPSPDTPGIVPADQVRVTTAGLAGLSARRLHFAQVLLPAEAGAQRPLLEQVGFHPLASLAYLERDARYPWVDPPAPAEAEWVHYRERNRALFGEVVLATYQDSLDCPELAGLRPIDDILTAHQASGRFDPLLWEVARADGQPAGCLLLSRHRQGPMLEIVYMGVVPAWRRRGVGALLLRRALERCRNVGARQLTVVVDSRNEPAKQLYARFGFLPVGQREVYLYRWGPAGGAGQVRERGKAGG